ncbi:hypothetical protein GUJ93_ZPchr0004g38875 [Zizania palustris]|uniref:Uncharacterized protein n=1 Tax=Zizania palustris TaxID=103762 RepID=A0A8J5SIZ6_ZIZPA|nr:hypothetical protein GUJ93_ZPchr0004g38875 [Zizania palustris]
MAALSDIDNTSSEDPSSDEDEPDEKKEKMKDFNGLCFMANGKQSSDEPNISELLQMCLLFKILKLVLFVLNIQIIALLTSALKTGKEITVPTDKHCSSCCFPHCAAAHASRFPPKRRSADRLAPSDNVSGWNAHSRVLLPVQPSRTNAVRHYSPGT